MLTAEHRALCLDLGTLRFVDRKRITKYKAQRTKKMQLARVIGTVVATMKNDSLHGRKLLIVQTVNKNLEPSGKPMVAVDAVGAGVGELVFWCRGKEASFPFKREDTPTDCTIIGIVDSDAHVTNGSSKSARQIYDDSR